jgi:two-component system response regulator YesN
MDGVLIVDDEVHAAHGIEAGIEWAKLGVSSVYVAYNIRQAKEIYTNHSVSLMICDIEMPQGNGIELLSWVKEHYPATESLFLTCHADFGYAKQALQLGSLDYLLKPVRYEELAIVLNKAIHKIEADSEAHKFTETLKHYFQLWSAHHPLLVERFWLDLINQAVSSHPEQINDLIQKRNIPYHPQAQFVPILISVHGWSKELSDREKKIMEYALRNAAEHSFQLDGLEGGCVVQTSERGLLALLPKEHPLLVSKSQLEKELKGYINSCGDYFYCELSCCIGNPTYIAEIHKAVESLIQMDMNNVTNSRKVYRLDEKVEFPVPIELPNMSNWVELLKQGAKASLLAEIHNYWEAMKLTACNAKMLQEFYQNFLQMVYHVLQLKGLQAHLIFSESISSRQVTSVTRSISNLQEWAKQIVEMAVDFVHSVEESHTIIDRVKKHISENIDKDLSRDDIAAYIYLSPDYLSRVFKKETGVSLSEYLIEEKFKFAQNLLIQSDMSISEIATSIGYTNFSHFSKMFKRVTDMNPLEFRKRNRQ